MRLFRKHEGSGGVVIYSSAKTVATKTESSVVGGGCTTAVPIANLRLLYR